MLLQTFSTHEIPLEFCGSYREWWPFPNNNWLIFEISRMHFKEIRNNFQIMLFVSICNFLTLRRYLTSICIYIRWSKIRFVPLYIGNWIFEQIWLWLNMYVARVLSILNHCTLCLFSVKHCWCESSCFLQDWLKPEM